jgi:Ca2+-binding RTX toxin-like protein
MRFPSFIGKGKKSFNKAKTRSRCKPRNLRIEGLEGRQLMAAVVGLVGNELRITADPSASSVEVREYTPTPGIPNPQGLLIVTTSGHNQASPQTYVFPELAVGKITFTGGANGDRFENFAWTPWICCVVNGNGGDDWLRGGMGADTIDGGLGNDTIYGGASNDTLVGNYGNDKMYGESGDDKLYGGSDNDSMYGGDGNDYLNGYNGVNYMDGENGNDTFDGGANADTMIGGYGNDTMYGYAGDDKLYGGSDDDKMYGGDGNDYLNGYNGVNTMDGGNGNDTFYGGANVDTMIGGYGNDTMYAYAGNDKLYGGCDNDYMDGGDGDDYLDAYSGNDSLRGGNGKDTMYGGVGNDSLLINNDGYVDVANGGAGADRFLVQKTGVADSIDLGSADARIYFENGKEIIQNFSNFKTPGKYAAGSWSTADIDWVDSAFAQVALRTNNNKLVKTKSGGEMTFVRQGNLISGTGVGGWNGGGKVTLVQSTFNTGKDAIVNAVFHEIGHNWDDEYNAAGWRALSGWTSTNPKSTAYNKGSNQNQNWWYLKSAAFVGGIGSYACSDPNEDFAESFRTYFLQKAGMTNVASTIPAKITFIDKMCNSLV